jgi:hypothetical protein
MNFQLLDNNPHHYDDGLHRHQLARYELTVGYMLQARKSSTLAMRALVCIQAGHGTYSDSSVSEYFLDMLEHRATTIWSLSRQSPLHNGALEPTSESWRLFSSAVTYLQQHTSQAGTRKLDISGRPASDRSE